MSPDDVNRQVIGAHTSYTIGACGKQNTWSGAEGQFDLYDKTTDQTICTVFFYTPHGSSYNNFRAQGTGGKWSATTSGGYFGNDGPLGACTVTLNKNA
jgi:hypothetical protein